MCRLLLYKGKGPILLADLLTRPAHSIINQSFSPKLRIDASRPLNGDGFGVGWYDNRPSEEHLPICTCRARSNSGSKHTGKHDTANATTLNGAATVAAGDQACHQLQQNVDSTSKNDAEEAEKQLQRQQIAEKPCIFTSVYPAWNNLNLSRLAEKIESPLVFAHIRAASPGFAVAESNCHPWSYGKLMFMHNGFIADFGRIKRRLQQTLREELFIHVQGNTDSEWCFALMLNQLDDPLHGKFDYHVLSHALLATINLLNQWSDEAGITQPSLMNFAVTDGVSVVCTRYVNRGGEAASLFFSSGTAFEEFQPGQYRMVKADRREDVVIVTSEPLTFESSDWLAVPLNTILAITPKLNVLLQPILDRYYPGPPESVILKS